MKRVATVIALVLLLTSIFVVGIFQRSEVDGKVVSKTESFARPVTALMRSQTSGLQGPGYYETSEYFIGKVASDIIFIESNGVVDPSTEDWTSGEKSTARSAIVQANQWWRAQSPNGCAQGATGAVYTRYTNYEPISRPSTDEYLWISEAVTYQPGYPGDPEQYIELVYDYVNGRRTATGADWFFLIFMIDSSNDADGYFADGKFAYAYPGGPFIVMTYTNDGYGSGDLARTAAHEIGHMFWATDEKDGVTENSGYLNVFDVEGFNGVMYGEGGFDWAISPGTWGQVGWRDSDSDGIQDIVDTFPNTFLNSYSPDPTTDSILTYTGTVAETPYPNNNPYGTGRDITVNRIVNVEFRVDSGPWINASSDDGTFNETEESFSFITPPLSPGTHTIETRGINSVGNAETTYAADTVTVEGHDVAVTNVSPVKTSVAQNYTVSINVTVFNQGDFLEILDVAAYANETVIGTFADLALSSSASTTLTFVWNTEGFEKGNYTLSAVVDVVPGETDTADNTFIGSDVAVTVLGDVDGDFAVTILDVVRITGIYASELGDPIFNSNSDLNDDGNITILDVVMCTSQYGQKWP